MCLRFWFSSTSYDCWCLRLTFLSVSWQKKRKKALRKDEKGSRFHVNDITQMVSFCSEDDLQFFVKHLMLALFFILFMPTMLSSCNFRKSMLVLENGLLKLKDGPPFFVRVRGKNWANLFFAPNRKIKSNQSRLFSYLVEFTFDVQLLFFLYFR